MVSEEVKSLCFAKKLEVSVNEEVTSLWQVKKFIKICGE